MIQYFKGRSNINHYQFIYKIKRKIIFMQTSNLVKSAHFQPIGKLRFMSANKIIYKEPSQQGRYHMEIYDNDSQEMEMSDRILKGNPAILNINYHIKELQVKSNKPQNSQKNSVKSPPRKVLKTLKNNYKKNEAIKQQLVKNSSQARIQRNSSLNYKSIFVKVSKDDDYFYESSMPEHFEKINENIHKNNSKNKYSRQNLQLLNQKLRSQRSYKKLNTQANFKIQNCLQQTKKTKVQGEKTRSLNIKFKTHQAQPKSYGKGVSIQKQPVKTARQTFKTKIKNKRIDDNPHVFANLLKKKINNLSKVEMYDYVNALVRKLNQRIK